MQGDYTYFDKGYSLIRKISYLEGEYLRSDEASTKAQILGNLAQCLSDFNTLYPKSIKTKEGVLTCIPRIFHNPAFLATVPAEYFKRVLFRGDAELDAMFYKDTGFDKIPTIELFEHVLIKFVLPRMKRDERYRVDFLENLADCPERFVRAALAYFTSLAQSFTGLFKDQSVLGECIGNIIYKYPGLAEEAVNVLSESLQKEMSKKCFLYKSALAYANKKHLCKASYLFDWHETKMDRLKAHLTFAASYEDIPRLNKFLEDSRVDNLFNPAENKEYADFMSDLLNDAKGRAASVIMGSKCFSKHYEKLSIVEKTNILKMSIKCRGNIDAIEHVMSIHIPNFNTYISYDVFCNVIDELMRGERWQTSLSLLKRHQDFAMKYFNTNWSRQFSNLFKNNPPCAVVLHISSILNGYPEERLSRLLERAVAFGANRDMIKYITKLYDDHALLKGVGHSDTSNLQRCFSEIEDPEIAKSVYAFMLDIGAVLNDASLETLNRLSIPIVQEINTFPPLLFTGNPHELFVLEDKEDVAQQPSEAQSESPTTVTRQSLVLPEVPTHAVNVDVEEGSSYVSSGSKRMMLS